MITITKTMDPNDILRQMERELIDKLDDEIIISRRPKKAWVDDPLLAYNTAIEDAITVVKKYFNLTKV